MLHRPNRFLAQFGEDQALIRPHLRRVSLRAGQVLSEPGERIKYVYFLDHGAVSKLTVFDDGTEIECALIGREGVIGAMSALGLRTAVTRDVCHLPAHASFMDAERLGDASRKSERIHDALDRYCAWKMSCAIRNGACNARHPIEQRLARWLLTCSDVLESKTIQLSQDVFAKMLGVQRTSVNPILQEFRAQGLVDLGRSRLVVRSPEGLIERCCECYASMQASGRQLLA